MSWVIATTIKKIVIVYDINYNNKKYNLMTCTTNRY